MYAFEYLSSTKATRLYIHTSPHSHRRAATSLKQWATHSDSSSESDDFEITETDDWDDDDDDGGIKTLTAITSSGSKPPFEHSDCEENLLKSDDSQRLSELNIRTRITTAPSIMCEYDCVAHIFEDDDDLPQICEQIGSVVSVDQELDIAVGKLKPDRNMMPPLLRIHFHNSGCDTFSLMMA